MRDILVLRPGQQAKMGDIDVTVLEVRILSVDCIRYSVSWVTSGVRYEQVVDCVEISHSEQGLRALNVGFKS